MFGRGWYEEGYVPNYEFEVEFGLIFKVNFARISNISISSEYETIADGGIVDRMYFFEKPNRNTDTIIFSKGWSSGIGENVLTWMARGAKINDIMILVKKEGVIKKIFYIEQGVLGRISFSDLDAKNGDIMIKTMELEHTGIIEIPV